MSDLTPYKTIARRWLPITRARLHATRRPDDFASMLEAYEARRVAAPDGVQAVTRRQVLAYTPPALAVLTATAFPKATGSAPVQRIEPVRPRPTVRPAPAAAPVNGSPDYTG